MGFFSGIKEKLKAVAALPGALYSAAQAKSQAQYTEAVRADAPLKFVVQDPQQLLTSAQPRVAADLQTAGYTPAAAKAAAATPIVKAGSPDPLGGFFKDVLVGTARAPLRAALSTELQRTGETSFQPSTQTQRFFFGEEPVTNLETKGAKITGPLADFVGSASGVQPGGKEFLTAAQKKALTAGNVTVGLIGAVAESYFGGGGEEALAKKIAATSDVKVIAAHLAESKLPAELIPALSERLSTVSSKKEVTAILKTEVENYAEKAGISGSEAAGGQQGARGIGEPTPAPETSPLPSLENQAASTLPSPTPPESGLDTYVRDTTNIQTSPDLNLDHLNVSPEAKQLVAKTVEDVKPQLEAHLGKVLSNQEAIDLAAQTSRTLHLAIDREKTLEFEAALLRTRQSLAAGAESGTVNQQFIDDLVTVKTVGADIARKLQSLSIGADAKAVTAKDTILDAVIKAGATAEEIGRAAEGVDFNDAGQAAAFYRQFVAPKASDWIDLLRYNSMLSSPNTHINNAFGNLAGSVLVAPVEKALVGGLDFLRAAVTGGERKAFAGESGAYLRGYFTHIAEATQRFADVMRGKAAQTNLDTRTIPLATGGLKGAVVSALSVPMKLLEASDQFFTALVQGGEEAALTYRASKGVAVQGAEAQAADKASYRLFRQDLFKKGQGTVLDAVDHMTSLIMKARNSENPIVSTVGRFTVPFVKTPMNIFKQGLEYSPAGVLTMVGATAKEEQLAKAIIGTSVFAGAAMLLTSNRITWSQPVRQAELDTFKNAGMQPYSVKIGNTWYSYQKLPPALAFPLAMTAAFEDARKNGKADDNLVDAGLSAIAKYGKFLSDQSYVKSIGDLVSAVQGAQGGVGKFISNYPQQLVPYRAFGGWFARLIDASQRQVDGKASFIDQQIQQLMLNIPGLSEKVPARVGPDGQPLPSERRVENALLPVKTSEAKPDLEKFFQTAFDYNKALADEKVRNEESRAKVQPIYNQVQELDKAGKGDEAQKLVDNLSDEDYAAYKRIKASDATKSSGEQDLAIYDTVQKVRDLESSGSTDEADALVDSLSDDEYKAYKRVRAKTE